MSVGLAVLGTGRIVETGYVPAVAKVDGAKLVAILSRDQARADDAARRYGIDAGYSDLDQLLADPKVDAVIVASPDAVHEEQVIAAARAGKHILCEKPMGMRLEACLNMEKAVREAGIVFAMGYDNRFNPGLARMKELMDSGAIGPVRLAHAYATTAVSRPDTWRARGELSSTWSISAVGTHVLDVYRWFFGDPAEVGGGLASVMHGVPTDEIAVLVLHYPQRLVAEITTTVALPPFQRLELFGEKGSIVGLQVFGRSHKKVTITCNGETETMSQDDPFIAEIADFVEAVEGRHPPRTGLDDGIANVRIIETALGGMFKPI
jgi:UDP-N-acetyl-2-amino-2-deoxyglucuronate dehydrogenase